MPGPIRQRLRDRFPVVARVIDAGRRVGQAAQTVLVGSTEARPVDRTVEAAIGAPFLALVRKAVAAAVGAALGWLYSRLGWDLGFMSEEVTSWLVAVLASFYLTWRIPNAPKLEDAP